MPLISKSVPNLLGGVSQQPDAVRYDNQCEAMDNSFPSVLDGLIKRPPTEHVRKITEVSHSSSDPDTYFTHAIPLDADNQFMLIINNDPSTPTITVQNLDGTTPTAVLVPSGTDYLKTLSGYSAAKDIRAITIADYTFLVNRSQVTAMKAALSGSRSPESLLYIKDGDYGTTYTAEIDTKTHRPSARHFDGADDYFSSADNTSLQTGYIDFAFSMWVYIDTAQINNLANKYTGTNASSEYNFYSLADGKLRLVVNDDTGGEDQFDGTATTEVATGAWTHVICEHKVTAAGADVTFTVNGTSETISKTSGATISAETGTAFQIGAKSGSSEHFDGKISLVGFWKRVFTSEERTQLYNSGKSLLYSELDDLLKEDLISFWPLDEASGNAADSHGSNTLTDNGTVGVEDVGIRGEGHTYKTEVTTPSGNQIKEYDDDGKLKANTFDARDAIDTSVICKAFRTGTAYGFNSFRFPKHASNGDGWPDGGTIKEFKDGKSIDPGEVIYVADSSRDKITFKNNSGTGAKDTIEDNDAGTDAANDYNLTDQLEAGDKFFCTGSEQAGNNDTIFEVETVEKVGTGPGTTKITLTQSGVLTDDEDEMTINFYKVASTSVVGDTPDAANSVYGIRNAENISSSTEGSVVRFFSSDGYDFNFNITDGLSDKALVAVKDVAESLTDLPTVAPNNFMVKITGSAESVADDYYVKFVSKNGGFGNGTWTETVGPDIEYQLDPATMPHALIRQSDGVFRFTPLDGSTYIATPTGTATPVKYEVPSWLDRVAGDLTSNPNPTFVGKRIRDIFLYKNRLGLLADENVILSETSEFFNFFRTTVLSLLDTAPIDIASTHSKVSLLTSAVPFSKQLVLFSNSTQFDLGSGQAAFSPSTVRMTKTTSYDSVEDIRPLALGDSIYFGFSRGDYVGLRQYEVTTDTESIFEAEDISIQVPQYIKGSLRTLTGSSHEDVIFISTDTNRNHMFCYKFFDNPDGGRVQSAWSRFIFEDDDKIIGSSFVGTTLYITTQREDGIFLDKIRFESGLVDSGSSYRTLLDRRITNNEITFSGGGTTLQLPYKAHKDSNDNLLIEIIGTDGVKVTPTATDDSNEVTVPTDLSSTDFFLGIKYTMEFTFSDVVLRSTTQEDSSALISQGRKQVRYITLDYHDTSFFKVQVKPIHRNTSTHPFTGRILGAGENVLGQIKLDDGKFRVPVYSKNTEVDIKVINDSPLPCAITSAEFELTFDPRSKRF